MQQIMGSHWSAWRTPAPSDAGTPDRYPDIMARVLTGLLASA